MTTPTDPPATPSTYSASGTIAQASATTDAVQLLDDVPLTEAETEYVEAARAANTLARDVTNATAASTPSPSLLA